MRLLALDTSTRYASIALTTEGVDADEFSEYSEYTWYTGNNHNTDIFVYMRRLLDECETAFQELDGICVATGPGSFNGVRVAVATAKTLAYTLQKPLVGVSTLDIIAGQQRHAAQVICAVLEAGRGDLYAGCYRVEPSVHAGGMLDLSLVRLSEYLLLQPAQLAEQVAVLLQTNEPIGLHQGKQAQQVLFCGEMSKASYQALNAALPTQCLFMSKSQSMRHASVLTSLGWQRLQAGQSDDPLVLEPLYLRRPSITRSTRKQPLLTNANQPLQQSADQSERDEGALHH